MYSHTLPFLGIFFTKYYDEKFLNVFAEKLNLDLSLIPLFAKDGLLDYYLALRIMSYGIFLLLSDQIKNDIARMQKLVPGLLTGGRFGGFAVPLGAIIFAQEVINSFKF